MAVKLTPVDVSTVYGNKYIDTYDVTFDTSYPAGGEAILPKELGRGEILGAKILGGNAAAAVLLYHWVVTTYKLMAMFPTGGGATAPTSLTAPVVAVTVPSGATAVTSTAAQPDLTETFTPGQAKEVGATIDLSSITLRIEFTCI